MPLLLALANFAPLLMKYLGAGEATQKVTEAVAEVATAVTGQHTPDAIIAKLQESTELQQKFQVAVMEASQKWDEIFLHDVQDARKRDTALQATGNRNWRAETMYILAVIVVILVFYAIWATPHISEFVKGISTLVLGRFLGYLDSIYNFEFGTTRSSQSKDQTIQQLSKNGSQ
jgi:hypothetical protein